LRHAPITLGGVKRTRIRVMPSRKWTLVCPDCGSTLVVDAQPVASSPSEGQEPSGADKDFDCVVADLDAQKARAEGLFEREQAALPTRRLLEEKFREAMKRARQSTCRQAPFDLD